MLTDLGYSGVELMDGGRMTLRKLRKMKPAARRAWWKGLPKWKRAALVLAMPPILPLVLAVGAAAAGAAPVVAAPALAIRAIAKHVKAKRAKRAKQRKARIKTAAALHAQAAALTPRETAAALTSPETAAAPSEGFKIPPWLPLVGIGAALFL